MKNMNNLTRIILTIMIALGLSIVIGFITFPLIMTILLNVFPEPQVDFIYSHIIVPIIILVMAPISIIITQSEKDE